MIPVAFVLWEAAAYYVPLTLLLWFFLFLLLLSILTPTIVHIASFASMYLLTVHIISLTKVGLVFNNFLLRC